MTEDKYCAVCEGYYNERDMRRPNCCEGCWQDIKDCVIDEFFICDRCTNVYGADSMSVVDGLCVKCEAAKRSEPAPEAPESEPAPEAEPTESEAPDMPRKSQEKKNCPKCGKERTLSSFKTDPNKCGYCIMGEKLSAKYKGKPQGKKKAAKAAAPAAAAKPSGYGLNRGVIAGMLDKAKARRSDLHGELAELNGAIAAYESILAAL